MNRLAGVEQRATALENRATDVENRVSNLGNAPQAGDFDVLHTTRLRGMTTTTVLFDSGAMSPLSRSAYAIAVPGLEFGDFVTVSPPFDLAHHLLFVGSDVTQLSDGSGGVVGAVRIYLYNNSNTNSNAGSATWKIKYLDLTP